MGLGISEVVIIAIIVVVLFGPALAAFFLGYQFGRRRSATDATGAGSAAPEPPEPSSETAPEAADADSAGPGED
jgi:flagellar basal body-associated protein FliL